MKSTSALSISVARRFGKWENPTSFGGGNEVEPCSTGQLGGCDLVKAVFGSKGPGGSKALAEETKPGNPDGGNEVGYTDPVQIRVSRLGE